MSSVQVLAGRGLAARNPNGLSDPICLIGAASSIKKIGQEFKDINSCVKSEIKKWNLSPEWKNLAYQIENDEPVRLEVWNKSWDNAADFMGYITIDVSTSYDKWVPLLARSNADKAVTGEIHIVVTKNGQPRPLPTKSEAPASPAAKSSEKLPEAAKPKPPANAPPPQNVAKPAPSKPQAKAAAKGAPAPQSDTATGQPTPSSSKTEGSAPAPDIKPLSLKAADPPKAKETPRSAKHIMISYQWECQEFAKDLYNALIVKGFNVWMDIQGGMYGNIYESMARAINNASLVIPLMTPEYEKSPNCRRECELAAVRKIPMVPLKLTMFDPTDWLSTAIPAGTLWFNFSNRELQSAKARAELERVCQEIKKLLPDAVPRMKPTVFLSYTTKNRKYAEQLREHLQGTKDKGEKGKDAKETKDAKAAKKQFSVKCILPRGVESAKPKKDGNKVEEKQGDEKKGEGFGSVMKQRAEIEEQIRSNNVIAVILILTEDFEADEDCKFEVTLADSARKPIIPTLWKPLKNKYPPKSLEFCLKTLNPVDFVKSHTDLKVKIKVDYIKKLLQSSSTNSQLTNIISDKNYVIKSVGEWNEVDVTNWLRSINLQYYCQSFRNQHVNGRVLLGLTEPDLDLMKVTKLHQKIFHSKLQELYQNFNWTEVEVAEWLEGLKLMDCKEALFEAGIDGKSLLVLTEHDLVSFGLSSRVLQSRLMLEIYLLKLQKAKVPEKETYRFSILKDVLLPCPSDELNRLRFSPDMLDLFTDIMANVDSHPQGLTSTGLKKFLLALLLTAYGYKKTYPTKIFWHDATKVELLALRTGFIKDLFGEDDGDGSKIRFREIMELMDDFKEISDELNESRNISEGDVMMEFVVALRLYYVTLDNIITRLFAVFDRMVNGVIALGELVAGLDLLIYGSNDAKYKLAFSLMDFNGDGSLSREEYAQFNRECFLPVLRDIKEHNLIPDFSALNKHSFLFKLYDQLKEALIVSDLGTQIPSLLNDNFHIESYTGGAQGNNIEEWGIKHAFQHMSPKNCHCSKEGKNFDIYLSSNNPAGFQLTNFYIGGNEHNCTCYLQDALVWFSNSPIDWQSYTAEYDNFTEEKFNSLDEEKPNKPNLFVHTTGSSCAWVKQFNPPERVTYIHIKLIRPHKSRFGWYGGYESDSDSGSGNGSEAEGEESESEEGGDKEKNEEKSEEKNEEKNEEQKDEQKEEQKSEENQEKKEGQLGSDEESHEEDQNQEESDEEDATANIDIEFIGLWGFPGEDKLEENREEVDTKNLRNLLGFQRDDDDDDFEYDQNDLTQVFNVQNIVNEYLKAAVQVADGLPLPDSAGELGVKIEDVEGIMKQFLFIEDNPGRSLMELLPIVHLFGLFMGYPPLDILKQPM